MDGLDSLITGGNESNKTRILVTSQRYFGLDPLVFRRGVRRALARVAGLPLERRRASGQSLCADFRLDATAGETVFSALVAAGLLQLEAAHAGLYRLTDRFGEFALAQLVPPLQRERARELLEQTCQLAAKINANWTHNPLTIDTIAVSGGYMSRARVMADLTLWLVVKSRLAVRVPMFRSSPTRIDGAAEISAATRALSGYILVHIVSNREPIERPFSVPFRANEVQMFSPPTARLREWSSLLRRQIIGR
jgi:hypothetical protein